MKSLRGLNYLPARRDGLCPKCLGSRIIRVAHYQVPDGVPYDCQCATVAFGAWVDGLWIAVVSCDVGLDVRDEPGIFVD